MKTLSTECILTMLNPEQQKELFYALEMIIPREDLTEKLGQIKDKYFDLVWLARKRPGDLKIPAVKAAHDKVRAKYPEEVEQLEDEDIGNWAHGFNSGMLACARLLSAYCLPHNYQHDYEISDDSSDEGVTNNVSPRDQEIEQAEEDFPFLDT